MRRWSRVAASRSIMLSWAQDGTAGVRERYSVIYVALLRGINVGGGNKILMADLRSCCTRNGCEQVRTYIQSGNLVLTSGMSAERLEKRLEIAIQQDFGFALSVLVRSGSVWQSYVKGNPFRSEVKSEARWVLLCLSKRPPTATAASDLRLRATRGERVIRKGDAIWIHYSKGIAQSKLSPTVLGRLMESPVTTRNWRTVLKLDEMVRETFAV